VTTANPPTTANTDHAFKLQNSTANSAAPCAGSNLRDLRDGLFGPSASQLGAANLQLNFCTPAYALAANQTSLLPAQTATVRLNLQTVINAQGSCTITANLRRAGTAANIASATWFFDKSSSNGYFLRNLAVPATTLAAGDKLLLNVGWSSNADCGKLTLHYGGTTSPGELNLRRSVTTATSNTTTTRPNPPTGLVAATQADGTVKLTWNKPAGGPPVEFYRIYRTTRDWTNRLTTAAYDSTAGATTDAEFVNGGAGTYWVTAVAPSLTESPFSNSVTVP
jgi:hypothetical protein